MEYEQTLFTQTFGDYPIVRVLDYLIGGRGFDYSLSDIAEEACVSWSTIHEIIPQLEKSGIIIKTREIGRAKMYTINTKNPISALLINMYKKLLRISIDKVIEQNRSKVRA